MKKKNNEKLSMMYYHLKTYGCIREKGKKKQIGFNLKLFLPFYSCERSINK